MDKVFRFRRPKALRQTLTWHNDASPDEVTSRDVTAWPQTWHMGKFVEFHPQQNFLETRLTTMGNEECLQKHQAYKAKAAWSCVTVLYTYVHPSLIPHFRNFCLAAVGLQNTESVFGLGLCVAVVVCFVGMLFGLFSKVGFGVCSRFFGRGERELFSGLLLGGCVSFEGGCAGVLWFVFCPFAFSDVSNGLCCI